MKRTLAVLALCVSAPAIGTAQNVQPTTLDASASTLPGSTRAGAYNVIERGPNHRLWQRVALRTNDFGQTVATTNRFLELASGLHRNDPDHPGQWLDSSEQIDLLEQGGAIAQKGPYRVYFPASLYDGAIEIEAPDASALKPLQYRPLGLSYFDGQKSI
jgi:hypothetical protein